MAAEAADRADTPGTVPALRQVAIQGWLERLAEAHSAVPARALLEVLVPLKGIGHPVVVSSTCW